MYSIRIHKMQSINDEVILSFFIPLNTLVYDSFFFNALEDIVIKSHGYNFSSFCECESKIENWVNYASFC